MFSIKKIELNQKKNKENRIKSAPLNSGTDEDENELFSLPIVYLINILHYMSS